MQIAAFRLLAIVLLLSSCCVAQEKAAAAKASDSQRAAKILVVSGRVSNDGRTLLTDLDSEWKIANADMLKGQQGHLVRVRCYVDMEKNQIQILSVKKENGESTYAARYGDSAFRR
jgi:hypothetical protein